MTFRSTHVVATLQGLLILPAALFLSSVGLRYIPALHDSAQWVVMLYAERMWTLWLLLLAFPVCVLMIGGLTVLQRWCGHPSSPGARQSTVRSGAPGMIVVAELTLFSITVLIIVVLHMLAT